MKKPDIGRLPLLILGLGGVGLALRVWLFAAAEDGSGLLKADHPAAVLIWAVTAAALALLLWQTRHLDKKPHRGRLFPRSLPAAVGCWLVAAGIAGSSLSVLAGGSDAVGILTGVLGLLSVPALIPAGLCRMKGKRPSFLLYLLPCLYLTARLFYQYRHWSANPQLQSFCFQLLACVALALASYQRAAYEVRLGNHRAMTFWSLAAVYFCCLSLSGGSEPLFYLAAGAWALTALCPASRPEPAAQEPPAVPQPPEEGAAS